MLVDLPEGYRMFVEELGNGLPLIVLHGGPGFDHSMFRPYLDPLADDFRLLYVDERGQGRSDRVDPTKLSLDVFSRDVDRLADALELDAFVLVGHSFGAIIATDHATRFGTATAYVISAGADASDALMVDVQASLEAMGEAGKPIAASWDAEASVATQDELKELWRQQAPFHFHREPPAGYGEEVVGAPEVLRHFATAEYGNFDFRPRLRHVEKPTLIVVGEHDRTTTPRAAHVLHDGISNSELVVIPDAGHMSFVEQPERYIGAVRGFLSGVAVGA